MKSVFLKVAMVVTALSTQAPAESLMNAWALGNVHFESRDGNSFSNFDGYVGLDFPVSTEDGLFLGPQLGVFVENVLTFSAIKSTKPSLGARGYKALALSEELDLRPGVVLEFLKGDDNDPIYFLPSLMVGVSYKVIEPLTVDVVGQYGIAPFFHGVPNIFRIGIGIGLRI